MAKEPTTVKVNFRELTEHILNSYLNADSEEDMEIFKLLDESMSVIGTGRQEFFRNLQEFSQAFVFDVEQREKIQFKWTDFKQEEQKIDEDHMLVYGSVLILGMFRDGDVCIRMDSRFTILYGLVGGIWKVLHIHHSVPDKEQMQNEEFPRTLGQQIEESQHMIRALASDYVVVYLIEPEEDRAGIVKIDETIAEGNGGIPESFCYSKMFRAYAADKICEEDRDNFLRVVLPDALCEVFRDGRERFELNYRILKDGKRIHYGGLFVRISKQGEALKLIAGFRNTQDIVNIQKMAREKDEKLEEMHEILATTRMATWSIFLVDGKAPRLEADDLMLELLGITDKNMTPEEIYDAWFSNIVPASLPSVQNSIEKMKKRGSDENTYLWRHPVRGERYVRCGGTAKPIEGGFVLRGYHYDVDETVREQKKKDEALAHALVAAQQANKAKTTFLNSMSHDIRTPMNAIVGFTALAQMHSDDQAQVQDYLGKISTSSAHLLSLINDILDMSRIESGTVKLQETVVHIPDMLGDLRTMLQGLIKAKNQHLSIEIQNVVHEDVLADKLRLNQILLNIVGNAIKFTQPGGDISIRLVEKPCSRKGYTTYEFSVKDNGIGMSKEFLGHIFETFSREYSATVSGIQGTGLGMAITKNIVDMMGGDISVESEEGKGSLFTVTLDMRIRNGFVRNDPVTKLHEAKELIVNDNMDAHRTVSKMLGDLQIRSDWTTSGDEEIGKKKIYDYSGKRALLVEDNELNREIATALLEEAGMKVDSVNDGDIAVSVINKAPADQFDLIFMDIQMPKMDGYTATREIRTLPDNRKANIPIIAMTANAFEEDRRKSYESGMNGHIIKPISIEEITRVLDGIFAKDVL